MADCRWDGENPIKLLTIKPENYAGQYTNLENKSKQVAIGILIPIAKKLILALSIKVILKAKWR